MQSWDDWAGSGVAAVVRASSVEAAVLADVESLGPLPAGSGALVASAVALARELDVENSATSKSMCARALREAMDRLMELAPQAGRKPDALDDLSERRRRRRAS